MVALDSSTSNVWRSYLAPSTRVFWISVQIVVRAMQVPLSCVEPASKNQDTVVLMGIDTSKDPAPCTDDLRSRGWISTWVSTQKVVVDLSGCQGGCCSRVRISSWEPVALCVFRLLTASQHSLGQKDSLVLFLGREIRIGSVLKGGLKDTPSTNNKNQTKTKTKNQTETKTKNQTNNSHSANHRSKNNNHNNHQQLNQQLNNN